MIPRQGPFHASLNAEESTIQVFWPVFEKLYKLYLEDWSNIEKHKKSKGWEKLSVIIRSQK